MRTAASNRDPLQAIEQKKLREDLYYRLNVFNIELPPLKNRGQDSLVLAEFFLEKHAKDFAFPYSGINADAQQLLLDHHWPGNVRELENMMERAIVLSGGNLVTPSHLPFNAKESQQSPQANPKITIANNLNEQVEQLECQLISAALEQSNNKAQAAQQLNISERSLWYKIKKYTLS